MPFDGVNPDQLLPLSEEANNLNDDDYREQHMSLDHDHDLKLDSDNEKLPSCPENYNNKPKLNSNIIEKPAVTNRKRKRASPEKTPPISQRPLPAIKTDDSEPFILNNNSTTMPKPSTTHVLGTFGRRNRLKGETLPAYHKRVSHELDSDDELMMDMREKGFSDRQIADKLASDGRVRYDQKSISTRIMRIRLAQAENVEFLLKEGYKEWEFEDDCLLIQAHALADIEVRYEIERIRAWRFRKVSEYMRRLNKSALFSENACRERYKSLIEGTARIPSSLDDDLAARLLELEAFRLSREQAREKEQEEKRTKEALEQQAKQDMQSIKAQKAEEAARKQAEKEIEKAKRANFRAAQAELRVKRSLENQAAKEKRNALFKKQKEEKEKEVRVKGQKKKKEVGMKSKASVKSVKKK